MSSYFTVLDSSESVYSKRKYKGGNITRHKAYNTHSQKNVDVLVSEVDSDVICSHHDLEVYSALQHTQIVFVISKLRLIIGC